MQQQAIEVSQTAFEKFSIEKDIAQYIKKEVTVASLQATRIYVAQTNVIVYSSTRGQEQPGIALSVGILEASSLMVRRYGQKQDIFILT